MLKNIPIDELISLRKQIHRNPELSGNEKETARLIITFAEKLNPDRILSDLGGNGVAVIFEGKSAGPAVMIRCDIDALPIPEENNFEYKSTVSGVAHKCGHDGHTTIVLGLMTVLSKNKPEKGKVILLFQPAEETGEGAERVLKDEKFAGLNPDYVFALHNLPGFEKNQIIYKENEFAAASKGLILKLTGKTSHAAEPEKGNSPALAVAEIMQKLTALPELIHSVKGFSLVTVIHAVLGERAFGTTPGYAEVMATLRTYTNNDMEILSDFAVDIGEKTAKQYSLKFDYEWTEEFPAAVNDPECIGILKKVITDNKFNSFETNVPFRWSEDFGHFTNEFKGMLFGLGSGIDHPKLHNPDYDFPDEIIETGIKIFYSLIKEKTS